tara:strand:- start:16 stop:357 length:342 start_codon:yes stop_codon:yes gene_type:complete
MNILSGLGAANGLMQGAASIVQSLKQPRLTDETFSDLFKAQLAAKASPEAQASKALEMSQRFVGLRDVDGDKMLRIDESGLSAKQFASLDRDKDGQLSVAEVQAEFQGGATIS